MPNPVHQFSKAHVDQKIPGQREKTKIVVFDAAPKAIGHMQDGHIDGMIVQNPYQMGYLGTKLMKALIEDDTKVVKEMFPEWDAESGKFTSADGDILTWVCP